MAVRLANVWEDADAARFFANAWPLYVHEITAFDTDFYAGQPFQRSHVITVDGEPVGFVCLGLTPFRYMPADADVILAELFVARRQRGTGVAAAALTALLPCHPGRWILRAIHDNARAIAFWRRTLGGPQVRGLDERREGGDVVWRFAVGSVGIPSP